MSTDSLSNVLMNNPNVPDSLKKQLESINPEAKKAWEAFETGTPCEGANNPNPSEKGGPYINYILMFIYQDTLNMRCYTSSIIEQKTIMEKMMETITTNANNNYYAEVDKGEYNSKWKLLGELNTKICDKEDAKGELNIKPKTKLGREFFNNIVLQWCLVNGFKLPNATSKEEEKAIKNNEDVYDDISSIPDQLLKDELSHFFGLVCQLEEHPKAKEEAAKWLSHFFENKEECSEFYGNVTAELMLKDASTQSLLKTIRNEFEKQIVTDKKNIDKIDFFSFLKDVIKDKKPNYKANTPLLFSLIGGVQSIQVYLDKYNLEKKHAELIVSIEDIFGVDEGDYTKIFENYLDKITYAVARPALLAFWILQHQRNYKPFKSKNNIRIYVNW